MAVSAVRREAAKIKVTELFIWSQKSCIKEAPVSLSVRQSGRLCRKLIDGTRHPTDPPEATDWESYLRWAFKTLPLITAISENPMSHVWLGGMYTPKSDLLSPKIASPKGQRWCVGTATPRVFISIKNLWELMSLRGARPFKVKLYLIRLNNKCFDFKFNNIYFDIDSS